MRLLSAVILYIMSFSLFAFDLQQVVANAKATAYQVAGQTVALKTFSPQGDVGSVGQARARFAEDMVRVGDKNVRNPFIVSSSCKNYGRGRWLDTRTWAYNFNNNLPVGTKCEFNLVTGLKSVAGKPVKAYPYYQFTVGDVTFGYDYSATQGVRVVDAWPYHGNSILDDQVFLVKLDKPTDPRSLPSQVYCLTSDSPEKLYAKFFTIQETQAWLAKQDQELKDWWRKNTSREYYDQQSNQYKTSTVKEWRALSCGRRLTGGQQVRLIWGKQVATATGQKRTSDQILAYDVRQPFTVSFSCPRQSPKAPCVPLTNMELRFSEVITADKIKAIRLQGSNQVWTPMPNSGEDFEDSDYVRFAAPFPANSAFLLSLPSGIEDVYKRPLTNAKNFPLQVKTGGYPPLAKFAADFGVIEKAVGAVPLTIRQLEPDMAAQTDAKLYSFKVADDDAAFVSALKSYQNINNYGALDKPLIAKQAGVSVQALPRKLSARDFEVIGIPVNTGLYIHEVESRYLGEWISQKQQPAYVHTMNLVTNLGIHVQMGKSNSLVWVTDLAKGQPVANATVSVWDCYNNKQLWTGQTGEQGTVKIAKDLFKYPKDTDNKTSCQNSPWLIMAKLGDDRSFALSEWTNGIETWRFNLSSVDDYYYDEESDEYYGSSKSTGDFVAHTVFDRSLLRVGETVHMQHLVRYAKLTGLSAPNKSTNINEVLIEHSGSGEQYTVSTKLSPIGNGESTWTIPKQAKLGEYCVKLKKSADNYLHTGCFNVSAFRLPVLKANLGIASHTVANSSKQIPLQLQLRYLNGGGYSNAPVTLRGRLEQSWLSLPNFEEYSFDSVPVMVNDKTQDNQDLEQQELVLDDSGSLNALTPTLPDIKQVSRVQLEMEFRDPSGETQTVGASSTVWPAEVMVGSKVASSWVAKNQPVEVDFISVNQQQQLQPNTPIKILGQMIRYESHRKRTLGGYYSYDTKTIKEPVTVNCGNQTDAQGHLRCQFNFAKAGELELTAISTDKTGRQAATRTSLWIAGEDEWWFEQGDDDRIDVLADKKDYKVGDVARLQVRMPFREATALVSVVRDGILESFVTPISGKDSVISVPIKPEYAPNVFISATIVRGRNQQIQPTALVDLGKPAFKLGIAELKVGWEGFQLGVDVSTDKSSYHPREQAQVTVKVSPSKGRDGLPNDTEVTLAVVDEALLELANNDSWNVLPSMMLSRAYGIDNATNQLQVVGKRHFGKKALPTGGGGGRGGSTRELFDTLLLWQASTPVDSQGMARFSVPLNDSLTSFKLVAIASSREQFGTGSASMRNTQELQILSGLPSVVRDNDRYQAEFTLRNSSPNPQTVQVTINSEVLKAPYQQSVVLAANGTQIINVPVVMTEGSQNVTWQVQAQSELYRDALKVSQKVLPAVPMQILSSELKQISAAKAYQGNLAALPAQALAGKVLLDVQPNLGGTLEPVKQWFRSYPYICLEQKTTKATGLQDTSLWADIMGDLPTYLDKDGLAKFYPSEGESSGSPFLTAHVLRAAKALNWQIPEDSRNAMLDGLLRYAEGKVNQEVYRYWIYEPQFDVVQRHIEVANILAQYGRFKPNLLDNIRLQPSIWPNHILIDWYELLKNANNVPKRAERLAEVERLLKAKLVQQGGTYIILKHDKDRWWWYDDDQVLQARLTLAVMGDKNWQDELPFLVRGLIRQQQQGHWQGTQSNLWGGFVLKRFNDNALSITGKTLAQLGTEQASTAWPKATEASPQTVRFNDTENSDMSFAWPKQNSQITVNHQGEGSPWLRVSSAARIPITKADEKGYRIFKDIIPIQQKVKGEWHVGDVMRVELSFTSSQEMGWVVVNDPIPTGAVLLGRGLKRDSELLNRGTNDWWPVYVEYAADAYRAYYQYLPSNTKWQSAYTVRLNQAGTFKLPATRVEAMYAPDVYGLSPNKTIEVKP
ncbi:MG2 domain-containing protein [uncultured Agitococcus sp.]|uniref:alpha-2-macroglobulin family protein n=1 Tax=uncultured Agitococcus sp. TaxID=1506599 RepID=UPI00262B8959|nr:MG2 domain-containing protein [uncultured Agitococcus sp.]